MNNIKNIRKLVTTAIMASALAASPAIAQSLSQNSISFQAVLNNGNGQALPNGSYNLAFRFYATATGDTAIGMTNVASVSVVNGVASTAIPIQAAWFDGQTRYLGVSVNGGAELQPRTLVTAVPYAVSASQLSTPIQEQAGLELRWTGDTPFIDFTHAQPLRDFEYRMSVTDRSDPRFVIRSDIADNGIVVRRNGFVGIGVPVPGVALDVKGEIRAQMLTAVAPTYHHALEIRNENLAVPPLAFVSDGWDGVTGAGRYAIHAPYAHPTGILSGPAATLLYWSGKALCFGAPELDAARPNFNVGIGTLNPQAKLDVRGTTRTSVLVITGGADLAEHLDIRDDSPADEFAVKPGMVVSIDPSGNRKFKLADEPYDRKRVGIISGGNGVKPGLVLRDEGNPVADGEYPVALTGQVWCYADAGFGAITPGDLLTTSSTPGHAMKVRDGSKARFTVLGQALTGLDDGRGWVQVLVGKQ